jgi:hypothetical protein
MSSIFKFIVIAFTAISALPGKAVDCFEYLGKKNIKYEEVDQGPNSYRLYISWNGGDFADCKFKEQYYSDISDGITICGGREYVLGRSSVVDKSGVKWEILWGENDREVTCQKESSGLFVNTVKTSKKGIIGNGVNIPIKYKSISERRFKVISPNF